MDNGAQPVRRRVTLTDISSRAWEHPADAGALVALRKLRGFDLVVKKMFSLLNERALRLEFLGSAIRVDERQYPALHRVYTEAGATLDVRDLPELYVVNSPEWNAFTIGLNTPFIVLHSALVQNLDEEEMRFALGHELGHALSGHAVYRSLLMWLLRISGAFAWVPFGSLGIRAIIAALQEWSRKAELSGDRAGVLACQDPAAALRVHMKSASGGQLGDLDPTAFLAQGAEYESSGDVRDSVVKMMLLEASDHPFAVVRATELRRWIDEGTYLSFLAGGYPRRSDDAHASPTDAAKEAARSYGEAFKRSQDPLARLVRDLGGSLGGLKDWVSERLPKPGQDDTGDS
ncbi:MAG: M48 family metallopeptidase [Nocardioides sp.]|nr:M48 family metallopeptidase [Nocardioides sp.]